MAFEQNLVCVTFPAGVDLSTKQFLFVSVASDEQIDPSTAGSYTNGILQNDPSAVGGEASVAIEGVSKVVCGGTISAGDKIAVDTGGKAKKAVSTNVIHGIAITGGVLNDIISIQLSLNGGVV